MRRARQLGRSRTVRPALRGYGRSVALEYVWRGEFADAELNVLHAQGFGHRVLELGWRAQLERHSLGWVTAHQNGTLAGFVNVAWDGDVHAFLLDTLVRDDHRHRGIGTRLVSTAVGEVRRAGCEWLHVDFTDDLRDFYVGACGFAATDAAVIRL